MTDSCEGYCHMCEMKCVFRWATYDAEMLDKVLDKMLDVDKEK